MTGDTERILAHLDEDRLLELELGSIRIPSSTFQEGPLADWLAGWLRGLGLEVEMMQVENPVKPGTYSRQPVALLKGTGGGPTLMLNGHMDPGVEMTGWSVDPHAGIYKDGWVWGMGAHDDKGGVAAMIAGVEALTKAGMRPKGDVLICPVVAHKYGGVGTRALLDGGITADMCINMEHSANTIANVCVGLMMVKITTRSPDLFFRYSPEARAAYWNPIEQMCEVIRRIGPSLTPPSAESWMTFTPHPDLPDFPKITVDTIYKDHYFRPARTDLTTRECEMTFQIRLVPGQTVDTVRRDVEQVLAGIKAEYPAFHADLVIPASGYGDTWSQMPMETRRDHPLVACLAQGWRIATGREPEIGGLGRLGNVGDGNILAEAGIPSVQFGPGDIRIYEEWPTPDERVPVSDLVDAARTVALATWWLANGETAPNPAGSITSR